MDEKLKIMNKVMGEFDKSFKIITDKKYEFDKKRMKDIKEAGPVYEGLRFAYIEMCKLQGRLDDIITKD